MNNKYSPIYSLQTLSEYSKSYILYSPLIPVQVLDKKVNTQSGLITNIEYSLNNSNEFLYFPKYILSKDNKKENALISNQFCDTWVDSYANVDLDYNIKFGIEINKNNTSNIIDDICNYLTTDDHNSVFLDGIVYKKNKIEKLDTFIQKIVDSIYDISKITNPSLKCQDIPYIISDLLFPDEVKTIDDLTQFKTEEYYELGNGTPKYGASIPSLNNSKVIINTETLKPENIIAGTNILGINGNAIKCININDTSELDALQDADSGTIAIIN